MKLKKKFLFRHYRRLKFPNFLVAEFHSQSAPSTKEEKREEEKSVHPEKFSSFLERIFSRSNPERFFLFSAAKRPPPVSVYLSYVFFSSFPSRVALARPYISSQRELFLSRALYFPFHDDADYVCRSADVHNQLYLFFSTLFFCFFLSLSPPVLSSRRTGGQCARITQMS